MGIIKRGILGGFSKKVGNVVGSSWKGIAVIKSQPLSVANPRTTGQVTQRNAFKVCSQFASVILASMIIPLMNRFAVQMSGYNMFVRLNVGNFDENGIVTPDEITFGTGKLGDTQVSGSNWTSGSPQIDLSWTTTLDNSFKQATDNLYVMVVSQLDGEVIFQGLAGAVRSAGSKSIQCDRNAQSGEIVSIYGVFLRNDGTILGNTSYFELEED